MRKVFVTLLAFALAFGLCGCAFLEDMVDMSFHITAKPKTFEVDGLSIELTTDFLQMDFIDERYDFIIGGDNVTVMGIKAGFENEALRELTDWEYAQLFRATLDEASASELQKNGNIPTFSFESTDEEGSMTSDVVFYKGRDCFWVVLFTVDSRLYEKYHPIILDYANTVKCE